MVNVVQWFFILVVEWNCLGIFKNFDVQVILQIFFVRFFGGDFKMQLWWRFIVLDFCLLIVFVNQVFLFFRYQLFCKFILCYINKFLEYVLRYIQGWWYQRVLCKCKQLWWDLVCLGCVFLEGRSGVSVMFQYGCISWFSVVKRGMMVEISVKREVDF